MVSLAQSIKADDIPPRVRIKVTAEDLGTEGRDFFGEGLSEQLFDTPSAIARVWRVVARHAGRCRSRRRTTVDPNGRKLSFEWHLLQGDPERVRIEPAEDGASARDHPRLAGALPHLRRQPARPTSRVDIGVFANNGVHDSAPAILSWYFPPEEARSYAPGPDGALRIASIDYAARARGLRRPDADPARRLARRLPLRPGRHASPAGPGSAATGRTNTTRPARASSSRPPAMSPPRVEAVAYPLTRLPDGGLGIEEISALEARRDRAEGAARTIAAANRMAAFQTRSRRVP